MSFRIEIENTEAKEVLDEMLDLLNQISVHADELIANRKYTKSEAEKKKDEICRFVNDAKLQIASLNDICDVYEACDSSIEELLKEIKNVFG